MRTKKQVIKTKKVSKKGIKNTAGEVDAIEYLFVSRQNDILRNERQTLLDECGKLAGQLAVAEREKATIEKALKAQIESSSQAIECQAKKMKLIKSINILLFIAVACYTLGLIMRVLQ